MGVATGEVTGRVRWGLFLIHPPPPTLCLLLIILCRILCFRLLLHHLFRRLMLLPHLWRGRHPTPHPPLSSFLCHFPHCYLRLYQQSASSATYSPFDASCSAASASSVTSYLCHLLRHLLLLQCLLLRCLLRCPLSPLPLLPSPDPCSTCWHYWLLCLPPVPHHLWFMSRSPPSTHSCLPPLPSLALWHG